MSTNLFQRLKNLLPQPAVQVVRVVTVDTVNGSSEVQFPGSAALTAYAANVAIGPLARVRGTSVAAGKRAFVRAGAIEGQAPDGDVLESPVGAAVPVIGAAPRPTLSVIGQRGDAPDACLAVAGSAIGLSAQQVDDADANAAVLKSTSTIAAQMSEAPDAGLSTVNVDRKVSANTNESPDLTATTAQAAITVANSASEAPDLTASAAQAASAVTSGTTDAPDVSIATVKSAASAYRYWRVNITSTPSGGYHGFSTFRLVDGSGVDLALNKTGFASSAYSGYEASKAFDGNSSTAWVTSPAVPAYCGVDLGAPGSPATYGFQSRPGVNGTESPVTFTIQASADGNTWTVIDTRSNQTNPPTSGSFANYTLPAY